jgi:hypothetical protein
MAKDEQIIALLADIRTRLISLDSRLKKVEGHAGNDPRRRRHRRQLDPRHQGPPLGFLRRHRM